MHARLDQETLAELRLEVGAAQLPEPDGFKELVAVSTSSEESAARATGAAVPEKVEALGQRSSASLRTLRSTLMALQDLVAKATRVLGDPTEELLARYDTLVEKLDRTRPGLGGLLGKTAGDPEWSNRVSAIKEAWAWSNAHAWLNQVSDAAAYEEHVRELHRLQRRTEKTTGELVSIRAWRAFFERLDQRMVHSLNAWTKAVAAWEDEMRPFLDLAEKENKRLEPTEPLLTKTALYETEASDWADVKNFFEEYGCVVVGNPELRWYRESWGTLMKSDLADVTQFEEFSHAQTMLKLRAICLLAMYLGIYQEAGEFSDLGGYFSEHPPFSWYLGSLKVELEDLWELGHVHEMLETESSSYWEDEETSESDLENIAMDLVRGENHDIHKVLHRHYGGDIGLFTSIWNSRKLTDEIGPALEHLVNTGIYSEDGVQEVWDYIRGGMRSWTL